MKPWKIIQKLESDNSRLFKESVIEENINDLDFQEGLSMCLDALVTFGAVSYTHLTLPTTPYV